MNTKRRIGILNSGGDCAGLNTVIASVVKTALAADMEVIGFLEGWEGILSPMMYQELKRDTVRGISYQGGTILRTRNWGRFSGKKGADDSNAIPEEILKMAKDNLDSLSVEGLIVIGGDGTLSAAMQLAAYGVNIIGVPKTIDNDLSSTDQTFGFSSAVDVATEAIDKIHTTASSHSRVFVVECMGRHAGWITLFSGLASGANAILLPEFPFKVTDLIEHMRHRQKDFGRTSHIIAIGEGAKIDGKLASRDGGVSQQINLGGVSTALINEIETLAPNEFEMRNVVLGHIQRGGIPNAQDRILSKRYGVAAVEAYLAGEFGKMVSLRNNVMTTVWISEAADALKILTEISPEYQTAKALDIFIQ